MSVVVAEGVVKLTADADGIPRAVDQSLRRADGTVGAAGQRSGRGFLGGMGGVLAGGAVIALGLGIGSGIMEGVRAATDFTVQGIGLGADLAETKSAVEQIFGEAAPGLLDFTANAARSLGATQQQALGAAQTFGGLGMSAGLAGEDLSEFTTDFVTLATDLASFNNTSPEQAIEAIGAALRGEAEPIRAYNVLLDDATLRNEALKLGLIETTKEALTPQQRVLAAQAAIMAQTSVQQGDFARTSSGLAGQQKILGASFEEVKTKLGTALLPAITTLVTFANDSLIPILDDVIEQVGPILAEAITETTPEFIKLVEAVVPLLPPLIELGVSALPGIIWAVQAIVPLLVDWTKNQRYVYDSVSGFFKVLNGDKSIGDFVMDLLSMGGTLSDVGLGVFRFSTDVGRNLRGIATAASDGVGRAVAFVRDLPRRAVEAVSGIGTKLYSSGRALIRGFMDGIRAMIKPLTDVVDGIVDTVAGFFPNSPAKRGPFSGAGWDRLGRSGKAITDQFKSRMDGDITLRPRIDDSALNARRASLADRRDRMAANAARAGQVILNQTIMATDPILGARQASREVVRYLGVA